MSKFRVPDVSLQIDFFRRLQELKTEVLLESLLATAKKADIRKLDEELGNYVKKERLQAMAGFGLRGELAFIVPYLLRLKPRLIGYYRLLLGFSQKDFAQMLGFGMFSSMEKSNTLSKQQDGLLPEFCTVLNEAAWQLVSAVSPLSKDTIRDLTLLTLGPQLRGGRNVRRGTKATESIFELIQEIIKPAIMKLDGRNIYVRNEAGRRILVEFGSDPDIGIREVLKSGGYRNMIAIEIKGGTDRSNFHNRLGEAEKSHLKAKAQGFTEFWTIVRVEGFDMSVVRKESPTTTSFFDLDHILDHNRQESQSFRERLTAYIGLKD